MQNDLYDAKTAPAMMFPSRNPVHSVKLMATMDCAMTASAAAWSGRPSPDRAAMEGED